MLESLAGCCTMFLFAASCKIGTLECNTYWVKTELIFIIFGQWFKLDVGS